MDQGVHGFDKLNVSFQRFYFELDQSYRQFFFHDCLHIQPQQQELIPET